ncbi:Dynamin GTPase effector domain [Geosmithia morbida]|uniref:Dynamin GTPase effector domain n=1 Tax=Geosmithia morbida TaxID=1094350 RepID=A0A9P5D2E9_9HYPO|nr:Dynamin GTPase effector domain [Geosmithia morbida]KAF4121411.1 Dynamin GTPase effector domain [Geosmithia morbida]
MSTSVNPRRDRSDAPTPSEPVGEPEPLLREMRMRTNPMALGSPTVVGESSNFHTSFQDIGKSLKACNDTLGELQGLGVSHDVPLPELVLVGDQSAGKSSVMSGLANLDLPRSDGTCTRCPLHIRVSRNSDWSCRVSLSKEYSYQPPQGRDISERDVTDQDPFFPWRRRHSAEVFEFKTVHDKSEIEDVLRWAQVAILNDEHQHELYVPGSGAIAMQTHIDAAAEQTSAKFSPNVVFLEIKGPELPNLSFYDMPGIFLNPADARDDYLVSVVRNLSMSYIRRESAIIMCSMPMNSDAENSNTFGLVRRLHATERTIGVLTKADLLPEAGNHNQWLDIMKGNAHQTGLGYFITSRPQGKDLDQLRQWEEAMFGGFTIDQWPETMHQFADRCGVEKLKDFLSHRLGEQFAKSLPHIERKVRSHLDKILRHLGTLPELPDNVELEIKTSLLKFTDLARANLESLGKHFNPLPDHFRECIIEIKPKFVLRDKSDIPVLEISDNDSDAESTATTNTPTKRRPTAPPVTPAAKRHRSNTPMTNGAAVKPEPSDRPQIPPGGPRRPVQKLKPPFLEFERIGRGFRTLRQVREEIRQKTRAGMPDHIPAEVYESLVLESMQPWERPMLVFLGETMRLIQNELTNSLNSAFSGLKKRIVFTEVKKHLHTLLDAHRAKAKEAMKQIYDDEMHQLLTFNYSAFAKYTEEEHCLLTRFRHKLRMEAMGLQAPGQLEDWDSMNESKRADDRKRREADLQKIGRDQFEPEVKVVAYVRGYYRLAALRFVDSVAQCVMCRMIPKIKAGLSEHLYKELGLLVGPTQEVYERLIEEDPAVASRRETLKKEKAKFEKALASIDALNSGVMENGNSIGSGTLGVEEHDADDAMIVDDATVAEDGI